LVVIAFLTSLVVPSFIAGWLVDSDTEDDSLPWYVSGALSVVLIMTGAVLALVVLTRFGFFDFLGGILQAYFGFATNVVNAVAEPVAKVLL
jgi:hypothetical protein